MGTKINERIEARVDDINKVPTILKDGEEKVIRTKNEGDIVIKDTVAETTVTRKRQNAEPETFMTVFPGSSKLIEVGEGLTVFIEKE